MTRKKDPDKNLYQIHFRDPRDGKIVSLKAGSIIDSTLGLSFICISDFVFDTSSLVVKPSEEHMKKRLEGVKALHVSLYSVISIEELGKTHKGLKFKKDKSNLLVLPSSSDAPLNPKA